MTEAIPPAIESSDAMLRAIMVDILALDEARVAEFDEDTELFGALAELDSQAVAGLLTEIEDRFGFIVEDDEVDGEMLETFGALLRFVMARRDRDGHVHGDPHTDAASDGPRAIERTDPPQG